MSTIINNLLDTDIYKLYMNQFIFHNKDLSDLPVTFKFINRSKDVDVFDYINKDDLEHEFDNITRLFFLQHELEWLKSLKFKNNTRIFKDDYLYFLKNF